MEYGSATHKGKVRDKNEDAYLVRPQGPVKVFAVADGMGGHRGGDVASALALKVLGEQDFKKEGITDQIKDAILEANRAIFQQGHQDTALFGMGTTLTVAGISYNTAVIGHVGDSRAYLYRKGKIERVTNDHSLVEEMIRQGKLKPEEAGTHPQRHVLMQALGLQDAPEVEIKELQLEPGDVMVLCTDGLTGHLSDQEIAGIIKAEDDPQKTAQKLVATANKCGGYDNITVVLFSYNK